MTVVSLASPPHHQAQPSSTLLSLEIVRSCRRRDHVLHAFNDRSYVVSITRCCCCGWDTLVVLYFHTLRESTNVAVVANLVERRWIVARERDSRTRYILLRHCCGWLFVWIGIAWKIKQLESIFNCALSRELFSFGLCVGEPLTSKGPCIDWYKSRC
jgi:hypothetical protein